MAATENKKWEIPNPKWKQKALLTAWQSASKQKNSIQISWLLTSRPKWKRASDVVGCYSSRSAKPRRSNLKANAGARVTFSQQRQACDWQHWWLHWMWGQRRAHACNCEQVRTSFFALCCVHGLEKKEENKWEYPLSASSVWRCMGVCILPLSFRRHPSSK